MNKNVRQSELSRMLASLGAWLTRRFGSARQGEAPFQWQAALRDYVFCCCGTFPSDWPPPVVSHGQYICPVHGALSWRGQPLCKKCGEHPFREWLFPRDWKDSFLVGRSQPDASTLPTEAKP